MTDKRKYISLIFILIICIYILFFIDFFKYDTQTVEVDDVCYTRVKLLEHRAFVMENTSSQDDIVSKKSLEILPKITEAIYEFDDPKDLPILEESDGGIKNVLKRCIEKGCIHILKEIKKRFNFQNILNKDEELSQDILKDLDEDLSSAYSRNEKEKKIEHILLRWACSNGQLKVVEWLFEECKFDIMDIRDSGCFSLSCASGNMELVKFLISKGVNSSDVKNNSCHAIEMSVMNDQTDIAIFLLENFEIDRDDVIPKISLENKDYIFSLFTSSCIYGNFILMKWLHQNLEIKKPEATINNYEALKSISDRKHSNCYDMTTWYCNVFSINKTEITKYISFICPITTPVLLEYFISIIGNYNFINLELIEKIISEDNSLILIHIILNTYFNILPHVKNLYTKARTASSEKCSFYIYENFSSAL